jgi:hypothetical protein
MKRALLFRSDSKGEGFFELEAAIRVSGAIPFSRFDLSHGNLPDLTLAVSSAN